MALLVLVLVLLASPALVGFAAVRGYPELAISLVDQEDLRTYTQLIKQVKSNEGLDDQEKQEAINLIEEKYVKSRNAKIPADKLNVDTLERAFERRMALERQYEKSMGTILNKYFSDANYK
ncbi:MAG: hypothetical protein IMX03_05385 [Brockia lithotrophica]|nr:hypothetical protein [Brockia lithotrophica]